MHARQKVLRAAVAWVHVAWSFFVRGCCEIRVLEKYLWKIFLANFFEKVFFVKKKWFFIYQVALFFSEKKNPRIARWHGPSYHG